MSQSASYLHALEDAQGIGIDVSKARLDVCVLHPQGKRLGGCCNTLEEAISLASTLCTAGYSGRIVVESTGFYHWPLVVALKEAGLDVRLINPLLSARHAKGCIRKVKSDPADSYRLACMAATDQDLPATWPHGRDWVVLRHQVGLLCQIEKSLQGLRASLNGHREALLMVGVHDVPLLDQLEAPIRELERARCRVQATLETLLQQRAPVQVEQLQSLPGVSRYTAGLMALFLQPQVAKAKAWVAFCGLDISVRRSGQWVGHTKVTKRGVAYLRKRLFSAAWGAKQNYPEFRQYYQQLRGEGRCYVECLLIIARRLLHIAFALLKNGEMYRAQTSIT